MSLRLKRIKKLVAKHNKPSESVSRQPGRDVRDSIRTIEGKCITSTGTFTLLIMLLVLPMLVSSNTYATDDSITVTIDDSALDLNIAPRSIVGNFNKSSDSTISVATTNSTGYTLGIRAGNAIYPDKLINGDDGSDNTMTLSSITTATTEEQFKSLAGTAYNKMWGYLPSKHNSTANTDFLPAPSVSGDIIDETTTANPATANTYTLAIGARVDISQKLGSYTNTYVVYASANPIPYTIVYDDNVVSNMPADVNSGQAVGNTFNLANETPTRTGYTFIGWCTVAPTSTAGTDTCSGTTYQPGGAVTITEATAYHFYSMWQRNKSITDLTYMQDFAALTSAEKTAVINGMETEVTYVLMDKRDEQGYTVAKLKDGKIWMTKNLNIAGGTLLNSDTTDFDSSYSLPTTQKWQSDGRLPESSTAGFDQNNYAYVYNSGNNTTNCTSTEPCYSYYSWDAATLGSGRSIGTEDTDAPYSICPKGWRLPTSGNHAVNDPNKASGWKRGDFYRLATAYGANLESNYYEDTTAFNNNAGVGTPANFLRAGYYLGGSFYDGGTRAYYWSSTSYGSTSRARVLGFSSGNVESARQYLRYNGFSVRCLVAQ